jgi:hypothetical protein
LSILFGPGGVIRTPDPYNPIVVRYQTALRPERAAMVGSQAGNVNPNKGLFIGNFIQSLES